MSLHNSHKLQQAAHLVSQQLEDNNNRRQSETASQSAYFLTDRRTTHGQTDRHGSATANQHESPFKIYDNLHKMKMSKFI